jgi:hypothetical protein
MEKPVKKESRKMEVRQDEMTQEKWDEMTQIVKNNVCGICGSDLTIYTVPETKSLRAGCVANKEHRGFIERTTYTQEFRRGAEVHPAIRDNIDRKMILPGGQSIGVALSMIQTRFPRADMDEPSAALFLWDCVRLDLDPLLGEIFPATFKTKDKDGIEHKVVQPIIGEDGWLSLAARSCAEAWAGPPRTMRLEEYLQTQDAYKGKPYTEIKDIVKEIKLDLCKDPEAYVWVAIGHRKDQDDTIGYGWYKKSEEGVVAKNLPGNQARVRAIKRWVREVFPEAKAKMKEMTAIWMERAGDVLDIKHVIEAEYHIVTEDPPTEEPPDEAIEGEGFNIKLTWLKESQKTLKWSDQTMLSFLAGAPYKVTGKTVIEAVGKLTRDKAEEFIRELQERADRQQPELFE